MKLLLLTFLLAVTIGLSGFVFSSKVSAASSTGTKARLHILPLECVLEKINNGITDIHLLTPADCKKKIKTISPAPFIGLGGISVIPLPGQTGTSGIESLPDSSNVAIEDFGIGIEVPEPDRNLFIRIVSLVFQAIASVSILFFIGYISLTKLFGLL